MAVALLLVAEAFSVTHPYDAAHDNGQVCAVCVSVATLGAGAVGSPMHFEAVMTPIAAVAPVITRVFSVVLTGRYARGPPAVSFPS